MKRPIKVGKRPINEGKRPIKAKVLVGVSVGSLMGCFRAPPPWRKTAPLKRPIKRSMKSASSKPINQICTSLANFVARVKAQGILPNEGVREFGRVFVRYMAGHEDAG